MKFTHLQEQNLQDSNLSSVDITHQWILHSSGYYTSGGAALDTPPGRTRCPSSIWTGHLRFGQAQPKLLALLTQF